jgi:glycosyltransferase involved in cell wall biosynthesis
MISIVIPSHNNLRHLKNAYTSIRKHAPDVELILIDDASTDGTYKWLEEIYSQDKNLITLKVDQRKGHTILYDLGIQNATKDIVGIMHADMIMGPNYIQNMVKHIKPGIVVCGTRVEPPLHPPGNEKIIENFGMDFDDLNVEGFESFCLDKQEEFKDQTTKGMFAPWIIYKKDFQSMGGHDAIFAPFPYEDSDIFQRWLLAGYELIQSRDAFVYHLTCRGHRWTGEIQKDDDYFKIASKNAGRNYIRKWRSWIRNDEFQHPVILNKYDIGFVIKGCDINLLYFIEPWSSTVYVDSQELVDEYINIAQPETTYSIKDRVKVIENDYNHAVVIEVDRQNLDNNGIQFITQLPEILANVAEVGDYESGPFKIKVNKVEPEKMELPFLVVKNVF